MHLAYICFNGWLSNILNVFSGLCKEHIDDHTSRTYSYVGTVEYMPPEIVSSDGHGHGRAVDWWSLGCMLYELTAGHTPFFDPKSDDNCADTISRRITKLPPPLPRWFSRNLKDIIRKVRGQANSCFHTFPYYYYYCSIVWCFQIFKTLC